MKTLKTLLTLGVIGFAFYALWLVIPCYFHNYQFQDDLEQVARQANYSSRVQDQDVLAQVVAKAQSYDIPLESDQVKLTRVGPDLTIETEYTVHVDLPLYPFDLKFAPSTKNHRV